MDARSGPGLGAGLRVAAARSGRRAAAKLAETAGFEPADADASPVFETGAFDRSATFPRGAIWSGQRDSNPQQELGRLV